MPTTIKLLLNIEFKMSGYCVFYFLCQVLFSIMELPKKKKNKGFGDYSFPYLFSERKHFSDYLNESKHSFPVA